VVGKDSARALKLTIADSGPGIPDDIIDQIFEPYFTTKKDGTGLGLATSHAIVIEHGGQITVSSPPGQGAIFQVSIPGVEAALTSPSRQTTKLEGGSGRILVMDDEVAIRTLLELGLSRAGYSVTVVGDGEQALAAFSQARAEGAPFRLALLDITVRGGMGGVEALAKLRQIEPGFLALATTGYADEVQGHGLKAAGFVRVIAKPFMLHELCATIKAILP
jgi:CheY-like chemotaxis protein